MISLIVTDGNPGHLIVCVSVCVFLGAMCVGVSVCVCAWLHGLGIFLLHGSDFRDRTDQC